MRVSVLESPGRLTLTERDTPRPGPDEVLVEVRAVGVCGSDTHYYEHGRIGDFVVESPLVLGHEASGVVVEVGERVDPSRVGQRVSIEPGVPCRSCPECLAGRYNLCPDMRFHATPPIDGSFAEFVAVHQAFAHPVPDTISDDAAALLEPLSVGVWACRKGGVGPGSRVLVTGAGPIGLVAIQVARAAGATTIVAADVNPRRLELARELGATHTVDSSAAPLAEGLAALDDGAGVTPQVLLECSGHGGATVDGLRALAPAGHAVLIGMGGDELALPLSLVQNRELVVTGTFRYANTWPTAIALAGSGAVDLDRLVTGHVGLADAADALTASRRDPGAVKTIVRPQS
ncbi:NAD(P)-dependent alcohol dehydrogenase [Agilicoccus flavus]|uniref:NAD(P)-dependent alcohol dehydrogenase n=1 Tax=Agilicoccus flavus TaxID=2775968 RepID=UPI001CF613B4|nr:NAD(P)-dependent alcohol dehydrogenase [Agilicoccus flavus]